MKSTSDTRVQNAVDWRLGTYGGAVLGGILWALAALSGVFNSETRHVTTFVGTHLLLLAAGVTLALIAIGAGMIRLGRRSGIRSIGLMLIVGSASGWLIVASLACQIYLSGSS